MKRVIVLIFGLILYSTTTAQGGNNYSGIVFHDVNKNGIMDGSETGTTGGSTLYVYLIDNSLTIVERTTVNTTTGAYSILLSPNTGTLLIGKDFYPLAITVTSASLSYLFLPPNNWASVGETVDNITNDGTADGRITPVTISGSTYNFGISQPKSFSCYSSGYLSTAGFPNNNSSYNGTATLNIFPVSISSGSSVVGTSLYSSDVESIAIAYNKNDNYIYGVSNNANTDSTNVAATSSTPGRPGGGYGPYYLRQYGTDFGATVGEIVGLPTQFGRNTNGSPPGTTSSFTNRRVVNWNCATYDTSTNTLWLAAWGDFTNYTDRACTTALNNRVMYPITLVSGVPTVGTPLAITGAITNNPLENKIADFTYLNGYIYCMGVNDALSGNPVVLTLYKIDPSTGVSTVVQTYGPNPVAGIMPPGGKIAFNGTNIFGGSFLDGLGRLIFYQGTSTVGTSPNIGRVIQINPFTGMFIDSTTGLMSSQSIDGASCKISYTPITLSGTVYNDIDAGTPNGTPINGVSVLGGTDTLWVNLLGPDSTVIARTFVKADGTYAFANMVGGNYRVQITQTKSNLGDAAPAINLHGTYSHVSSTDATPTNGVTSVSLAYTNVSGVNFGIQKSEPTANPDNSFVNEDEFVDIIITLNDDFGTDGPCVVCSTATIVDNPRNGTAYVDDGGTPYDITDDIVTYTPDPGFYGLDTLVYEICDASSPADCDTAIVIINVNGKPIALDSTVAGQVNPLGTNTITVNSGYFRASDPNDSVKSLTITSFPNDITSLTIGTTTYYPNAGSIPATCPTSSCLVFPSAGVNISTNSLGQPNQSVSFDPFDGLVVVILPYRVVDNFGLLSQIAEIKIPFTALLPVELINFKTKCENGKISINWQTASEQNSSHFEVEKSSTGIEWSRLGTVKAAGNSFGLKSYTFIDSIDRNQNNFYRLKMVDLDGSFEYSRILYRKCNVNSNVPEILIYPNPVTSELNIESVDELGIVKLWSPVGKLFFERKVLDRVIQISTAELPPGVYFLGVSGQVFKILK